MLSYQRLEGPLRLLLLVGAVPMGFVVMAVEGGTSGVVVGLLLLALPVSIALLSGTLIRVKGNVLTAAFVPFYRVRLPVRDIAEVDVVEVNPFDEFGGWGIKGKATGRGLLLSAGGTRVVSVGMRDGRRYFLSADEPQTVADQLQQHIARH